MREKEKKKKKNKNKTTHFEGGIKFAANFKLDTHQD